MNSNTGLYLKVGGIVVAIVFIVFMAAYVVPRALITLTKAAPATMVSLGDSTILGQKILAKANGTDDCIVNVFILDKNSKGVPNKQVMLEGMEDIIPAVATTNTDGKVSFAIKSNKEGTFELTGVVEGTALNKTIKVTFRN
ncbi:MAG: Ig-like domain-containing protein [Microgenomates group bacterium]